MSWRAYLSYGGTTVTIGAGDVRDGINATADGIEGWYSTPEAKWSLTERSYSDGSYDVDESFIIYAARVVTLHVYAEGDSRDAIIENHLLLLGAAHHVCTLRVVDSSHDTYVTGYATVEASGGRVSDPRDEVTVTLECPDPRRYASGSDSCTLYPPTGSDSGGLYYGEDAAGLVYDLTYGDLDIDDTQNVQTLAVAGTSPAYPLVTAYGKLTDGFTLYMDVDGGDRYEVSYSAYVTAGNPVVLDYRLRTATIGGDDHSRYLTSREFHGIEPGGSATFTLQGSGSGHVNIEVRDTYV